MKLIYGRGLLVDLDCTDPAEYGFDTFQLKNMHSDDQLSSIQSALVPVDNFFDPDVDFVLSITLQGDPRCGSNSDSGATASIDRDPWYNNASSPFYSGWNLLFNAAITEYGSRFKGIRWNHEYRPHLFKEGSRWVAYAEENAASDYRDVEDNYRTLWETYLNNIARTHARDAYLDQGRTQQTPYNTAPYAAVKRLYRHFVDFQCEAQARMVDLLASQLGGSKKLIIYPAQQTGHVHTAAEYTSGERTVPRALLHTAPTLIFAHTREAMVFKQNPETKSAKRSIHIPRHTICRPCVVRKGGPFHHRSVESIITAT